MTGRFFAPRLAVLACTVAGLSACDRVGDLDFDLRGGAGQLDTSEAVRNATLARPRPDARGVVSYPGYQVAVARRDDTVETVARRVGLPSEELARYNALPLGVTLREGEIIALPRRVAEPSGTRPASGVDVASIATSAIDRAEDAPAAPPGLPGGDEPLRHQVSPGETAFSIARRYDVPVAALAEWNGLGADLKLRAGQYLLIPVKSDEVETTTLETARVAAPGGTSALPPPPSAAAPLPDADEAPVVAAAPVDTPDLSQSATAASDTSRLRMPVQGSIIRAFRKGSSEGIGIAAPAGTNVVAAEAGTVAAITRDTDQVPILVLRHEGNLLTVYAGVDAISVAKGDRVVRGQVIAKVRAGDPSFLHFEVREGFDSVDPGPYLN